MIFTLRECQIIGDLSIEKAPIHRVQTPALQQSYFALVKLRAVKPNFQRSHTRGIKQHHLQQSPIDLTHPFRGVLGWHLSN